jgi:hypothetical protein
MVLYWINSVYGKRVGIIQIYNMRDFINENSISFEPGSRNSSITTLIGFSQFKGLTKEELKVFQSKKINPKITPFASDAVALIRSKTATDTLVDLQDIIDFIKGKPVNGIKGLVFDNAMTMHVTCRSYGDLENQGHFYI